MGSNSDESSRGGELGSSERKSKKKRKETSRIESEYAGARALIEI